MSRLREMFKPTPKERYEDRWVERNWDQIPDEVREPLGDHILEIVECRNRRLKKVWTLAGAVAITALLAEHTDIITSYHNPELSLAEDYVGAGSLMAAMAYSVFLARFRESRRIDQAEEDILAQISIQSTTQPIPSLQQ